MKETTLFFIIKWRTRKCFKSNFRFKACT